MKNLFLFIFTIAIFASCSDRELIDPTEEHVQLEERSSCPTGYYSILELDEIADFALTLSQCPPPGPACPNICSRQVSDCMEIGTVSQCVSQQEIRNWIRSFINSKLYCGKFSDGFCYPTITLDHQAFKEGRFVLCLTGNVWDCPEQNDISLTPCEKLLAKVGLSVRSEMVGLNLINFTFSNSSNQPLTVIINGSPFVIPANTTNHVIQFTLFNSVTISFNGCSLGTWNPIG